MWGATPCLCGHGHGTDDLDLVQQTTDERNPRAEPHAHGGSDECAVAGHRADAHGDLLAAQPWCGPKGNRARVDGRVHRCGTGTRTGGDNGKHLRPHDKRGLHDQQQAHHEDGKDQGELDRRLAGSTREVVGVRGLLGGGRRTAAATIPYRAARATLAEPTALATTNE